MLPLLMLRFPILSTSPFFFVLSYDRQSDLVRYELFKEQGESKSAF